MRNAFFFRIFWILCVVFTASMCVWWWWCTAENECWKFPNQHLALSYTLYVLSLNAICGDMAFESIGAWEYVTNAFEYAWMQTECTFNLEFFRQFHTRPYAYTNTIFIVFFITAFRFSILNVWVWTHFETEHSKITRRNSTNCNRNNNNKNFIYIQYIYTRLLVSFRLLAYSSN